MTFEMRDVAEQKRTYYFPDGHIALDNVVKVGISNTTHRIETKDGKKYIVPNRWIAIELSGVDKWSF